MTSDLGIYWMTQVLIDQHGDLAYMRAVKLRDAMRRKKDAGGELTWNRVMTAAERLIGDDNWPSAGLVDS